MKNYIIILIDYIYLSKLNLNTMKKKLTALFVMLALVSYGQDNFNKWSVDLGLGMNKAWVHRGQARNIGFPQLAIGGRYMLNNNFGFKLGYDYNRFKNKDLFTNVNLNSVTGSAVANLGHLLRFETFAPKFGLLMNVGAGASFLSSKDLNFTDKMLHGTVGFSPQYKISERISVNLNLSATLNLLQGTKFDGSKKTLNTAPDGIYSNLGAGVSINLGKNKDHADWIPTEMGGKTAIVDNSKYDAYEARIKTLEDSLANKTVVSDRDGDGIADAYDLCPDEAGLFSDNGCPDTDGDGVDDLQDKCPKIAGVRANGGCPEVDKEVKKVMAAALKGVQFQSGKAILLKRSNTVLDNVVKVMKENPSYYLNVWGYTDNQGDDAKNLVLSKDRANAVTAYLTQKGVESSRLHSNGFGEANPKASNETDAGRAVNRRVEFKVIFK